MKQIHSFSLSTLLMCLLIYAQTGYAGKSSIFFLDEKSQSNIVFTVCSLSAPVPCPMKYTNSLSNTNLFSPEEVELLQSIPLCYNNVKTNVGPPGSVLTRLDKIAYADSAKDGVLAHFTYTNSSAQDDVFFYGTRQKIVKHQSSTRNGFYALLIDGDLADYGELKDGKYDGLSAGFYEGRVFMWLRFTDGKALGKFYVWKPMNPASQTYGLALEAEFKEPYDFLKYQLLGSDYSWMDKPKIITNLWQNGAGRQ